MRKRWLQIVITLVMVTIIIILGSKIWSGQSIPDTPAFNHGFTKEFLVEDAETPEGFHLFESGTKKYTMLFPENYVMSDGSYYQTKGVKSNEFNTENVYLYQEDASPKEEKLIKEINLFLKPDGNVIIDSRLRGIIRKINVHSDTEIQEVKNENKTVYYVENVDDYHAKDGSIDRNFYYYGLITDNHSKQVIYFELRDKCFNVDTKECEIDFEKEKEMGLEMMKSVEFK